jgi:hypothetical protein
MSVSRLVVFTLAILWSQYLQAQPAIQNHSKIIYVDEDGKYYAPQGDPVSLSISTESSSQLQPLLLSAEGNGGESSYLKEGKNILGVFGISDPENLTISEINGPFFIVYGDGTSPKTQLGLSGANRFINGKDQYFGPGLKLDFEATDELSGWKDTYLSVNESLFTPSSLAKFNFISDKEYSLYYYSVDNVGNVEVFQQSNFYMDVTPPQTYLDISGTHIENILALDAGISFRSEDSSSGVKQIYYQLDSNEIREFKSEIMVSGLANGEHTIVYYSEDNVGNLEHAISYIFNLDSEPPTLNVDVRGNRYVAKHAVFVSGKTQLKLTAFDNKSGVNFVSYQIDDGGINVYNKMIDLPQQSGAHEIIYFAMDLMNNRTPDLIQKLYVDLTPPESGWDLTGSGFWNKDTLTITRNDFISLYSADLETGVKSIKYKINDRDTQSYNKPISIDADGKYKLTFYGVNNIDNAENIKFLYLQINNNLTSLKNRSGESEQTKYWIHTDENGLTGPSNEPFYLTISSSSDPTAQQYVLDMSTFTKRDGTPYKFNKHGKNIIKISDSSEPTIIAVNIDAEPPNTTINYEDSEVFYNKDKAYYNSKLKITLTAVDPSEIISSGVQKTNYSIDGSPFSQYNRPLDIFIREKIYKVSFFSIDEVGNIETTKTTEFYVDITPPMTKHIVSGRYFRETISGSTKIELDAFDNLSGLKNIYYYIDENDESIYKEVISSQNFAKIDEGNHILYFYSKDNVGNKERVKSFSFFLDHSPPNAQVIILNASYENNGNTFVSSTTNFKVIAEDEMTEVKEVTLIVNGNNFVGDDLEFKLPNLAGKHEISYSCSDIVENESKEYVKSVIMDTQPPTTTYKYDGPVFKRGNRLYISANTNINLTGLDDASGLRQTHSRIGDSDFKDNINTFNIDTYGKIQFSFYSTDNVNNREKVSIVEVYVDNKPPDIEVKFSSSEYDELQKVLDSVPSDALIYILAEDRLTGRERIVYTIDDGAEQLYKSPLTNFASGQIVNLNIRAVDMVENESIQSLTFKVQ